MGEAFAEAIARLLAQDPVIFKHVARTGIEQGDLVKIMQQIRESGDPMSRRLRISPDGHTFIAGRGMSWWEAKASDDIERNPYEGYMRYEILEEPVLLFFSPKLIPKEDRSPDWARVYVDRIKNIIFYDSYKLESRFSNPSYVDEDGWIIPTRTRDNKPRFFRSGSGTPYRRINIDIAAFSVGSALLSNNRGRYYCEIRADENFGELIKKKFDNTELGLLGMPLSDKKRKKW